jgi:uridine kinase
MNIENRTHTILDAIQTRTSGLIAIDGRATAGKSTIATMLAQTLDASIVHMDDFFLPPKLRTTARLAEAGGNIHYERFREEALPNLASGKAFLHRIFDCSIMDYRGERHIPAKPWRIVEGAYAHHPLFGAYMDVRVFADVPHDEQISRLRRRNTPEAVQKFQEIWIPMEELYLDKLSILSHAEIIV